MDFSEKSGHIVFYPVGYQGRSLESLCRDLRNAKVQILLDIRERAWSQRPEFRKNRLKSALELAGVIYRHEKLMGNPFRPRGVSATDRNQCFRQYREFLETNMSMILEGFADLRGRHVALLCYESCTADCHRSILVEAISDKICHAVDWRFEPVAN